MGVIVKTNAGEVEGIREDSLHVFKGIPFAAPPVGARRWFPPEPCEPWTGVRQAKSFGAIAPQNVTAIDPDNKAMVAIGPAVGMGVNDPQSEDCLYLNVWTPGTDDTRRPVMVWIHGGGFRGGSGSLPIYRGSTLAKRGDVVMVTINYRLGPLGFLHLNEATGGRIPSTGNEGLLDQVAALEWVRANIAAFGGDPDNVTIFGESAGGMSVGALLGLPAAKGLFDKAILMSGSASTAATLNRAMKVAERFLGVLGLKGSDVEALRSLTAEQLLGAALETSSPAAVRDDPEMAGMTMQPVVDGRVQPALPLDAVANGSIDGIPVLLGSNLNEWKLFAGLNPAIAEVDEAGLPGRFRDRFPSLDIDSVIEGYRKIRAKRGAATSPSELFLAIETDRILRMPTIRLAESLRDRGQSAYSYLFTWTSPLWGGMLGACHALALPFLWGTYGDISSEFSGTGPAADALATNIQDAWLAFARTGDPSCASLGKWSTYGEHRGTMMLGEEFVFEEAPYDEERRVWDSVPNTVIGYL